MSNYRSLNYTELPSIDIDNFNIIGVFKLTGATGTLPSGLTFPCIFENYEGFQIVVDYCNTILSKEQAFKIFSGKIAGLRKRIEDCTNLNELQNNITIILNNLKTTYGVMSYAKCEL